MGTWDSHKHDIVLCFALQPPQVSGLGFNQLRIEGKLAGAQCTVRMLELFWMNAQRMTCNDRRMKEKERRTKVQRGKCSSCFNKKHWTLNKTIKRQNEQSWTVKQNTEQKISTHHSKVKPGYLSMVLDQGQRLTAAADWEPYQARHRNPKS